MEKSNQRSIIWTFGYFRLHYLNPSIDDDIDKFSFLWFQMQVNPSVSSSKSITFPATYVPVNIISNSDILAAAETYLSH